MQREYPCLSCGAATVGNGRSRCRVCNRFAAKVRSRVAQALRAEHPDEVERLVQRATGELYPEIKWEG